jgi:hypothetical protein
MKRQHLIYFLVLLLGACVSVNIPTSSSVKAEGTTYTEPTAPFKPIKPQQLDKVWLSEKTGNTISYLSECENAMDPSLKQIEGESLSALGKLKIESSINANFNNRESLLTTASGDVDGIPAKIKLVIFKRNNCSYTLTYAGIEKNFSAELSNFDRFVESFKVP